MVHWTPSRVRKIFYIATKRHCEIIRFKTLLSYIFGLELFTFLYTLHLNAYRPKILEFRPYPFSFMLLTTFSLPHGSTASRQEPGNRSVSIAAPFPYPRPSGKVYPGHGELQKTRRMFARTPGVHRAILLRVFC